MTSILNKLGVYETWKCHECGDLLIRCPVNTLSWEAKARCLKAEGWTVTFQGPINITCWCPKHRPPFALDPTSVEMHITPTPSRAKGLALPMTRVNFLGRVVRETWIEWASEQNDKDDHPGWFTPWEQMPERDREVDRRIGKVLWTMFNAMKEKVDG